MRSIGDGTFDAESAVQRRQTRLAPAGSHDTTDAAVTDPPFFHIDPFPGS